MYSLVLKPINSPAALSYRPAWNISLAKQWSRSHQRRKWPFSNLVIPGWPWAPARCRAPMLLRPSVMWRWRRLRFPMPRDCCCEPPSMAGSTWSRRPSRMPRMSSSSWCPQGTHLPLPPLVPERDTVHSGLTDASKRRFPDDDNQSWENV